MTHIIPIKAFEKRRRHLKRYPSIYRPLTTRKVLKFRIRYLIPYPIHESGLIMSQPRLIPGKKGEYSTIEEQIIT